MPTPVLKALAPTVLVTVVALLLLPAPERGPVLALFALALACAGVLLRARPLTLAALLPLAVGFLVYCWHALDTGFIVNRDPEYPRYIAHALAMLAALLVLSELSRRPAKDGVALWPTWPLTKGSGATPLPEVLAALAAVVAVIAVYTLIRPGDRIIGLGGFALLGALYAWRRAAPAFSLFALLVHAGALILGSHEIITLHEGQPLAIGLLLLLINALFREQRIFGKSDGLAWHQHRHSAYVLYGTVLLLAGLYAVEAVRVPINGVTRTALAAMIGNLPTML